MERELVGPMPAPRPLTFQIFNQWTHVSGRGQALLQLKTGTTP